jgi:MoxR-like ATPase
MTLMDKALAELGQVVLGKPQVLKLAVACLLARGHLLIEDLPGMGKTTLAHALARVFGLDWQRVQFTSDMLPADILGVSIFDTREQQFHFKAGPVFTQLLLADEINRATPKTQSALLEAMEERQVTLEGQSRTLPDPFFVVATQNPVTQTGTFPLPESQLDRFLMRISLGYPDATTEKQLLARGGSRLLLEKIEPVLTGPQLLQLMKQVDSVHLSPDLLDYVQRLLAQSRDMDTFVAGLSPRAGLGLLQVSRVWALFAGRDYVTPDDVQTVMAPVCDHRLQLHLQQSGSQPLSGSRLLLDKVPVVES